MFRVSVLVLALGLVGLSAGQVIQSGQCNANLAVVADFDVEQFTGLWYEISRTNSEYQSADCSTYEFTGGNGTLAVSNAAVNRNFAESASGSATYSDDPARMTLSLSSFPGTMDYWILMTDYVNYALAYSCQYVDNDTRAVYLWKLGRETTYPNELIPALIDQSILNLLNINAAESMYDLEHTEDACYELPVIADGQPIVLPGQCDPNLTVVQNFDAARFLGRWHEVSSYYSENALGTCPNAFYSLNTDGSVGVVNSQVSNQTLLTISGSAVVSSTDGSGILSVTLEVIPGVFAQQELRIVATDYDNYAISYSCTNVGTTQKRVFAWIVSRSRQLSASSSVAVTQVVDSIVDLNVNYFSSAGQTDADCFYFPEPTGQPVVFPGTCDLTIPTVINFNAVAYMGLWYEIEGYPSTFQQGTCNNAFYTLNTDLGVVEVYNTQVINQTLDDINGIAVVASNDGSAKLEVTFPVEGVLNMNVTTDYWVLATDYDSYALVYTCQQLPNEQRLVFSWKLSRTKVLPDAANTAMNNVISTIDVLSSQYYVTKDQSVEGCFYYPEAVLGKPVVFPGQCDNTIAAVPNFNLAQFSGVWNEVEAYPKEEQTGQCINHEFALTSATTLSMVSNQITDQFLTVVNGSVATTATDGSARLSLTFTFDGEVVTMPYWILSTDYSSYALAYSCVDLNSDFRGIWSWKLSRTSALPTTAVTAINNAIAPIVVLDNGYFEPIDRSDEACFYLPDLAVGEPIILPGQCEDVPAMQNFDATRYTGTWRLIESYPSEFEGGECNQATYTLSSDGTVIVYNTQVFNQTLDDIVGSAVVASTDGTAVLNVTFPVAGTDVSVSLEYVVLDTDYDSYSLVMACSNISPESRRVWSWKMSRTRTLSNEANTAMNAVINTVNVLNNRYYVTKDHGDAACFYFPEPSDSPVLFRGQCDMTIPALANFDAVRYMGLWHEIESYPSTFQPGTCNNARYTLLDGFVNVYNTQVINQTLDDITGVAVIASDDGTAKLAVTFPVNGVPDTNVTISYWVLDTDYDSYALVYTCENMGEDQRAVFTWKLSRNKVLSTAANTAMNNIISTIPVLDQRYYNVADQTEAGCFYYPEAVLGQPVVFPGQCDNTIAAVPNFNLAQFSGVWNEIEAYPKEEQTGQCINHEFALTSATTLSMVSNQITDQFLTVVNGSVATTATDGSARLSLTFTFDGEVVTMPYWILSTDYSSYALAYSCVDLNSDFRGIWSWKLSRTSALPTTAVTAINNAIAPIVVLDNGYFEPIDQSDDACFYLPDLAEGEPIIMPGQCEDVPAMQNFDATRYTGTWRLIESYPSEFEGGECNQATYTLSSDGTVIVYNTQVFNQTLDDIVGSAVVASTDGTAVLNVTFPVAGTDVSVSLEYVVLDTDYDSYSLVMACSNISPESRRVWSWKMSRTRTLSNEANTAMNAVINRVNVLNNRYYVTKNHGDAACFYFPEPSDSPVLFRGQCDMTIPALANFDAVRYMGLWHEIESYPSTFQPGTCNNARYTLLDGFVNVYNTQVINQTLDDITGVAVIASDDGTAKLAVTFPVNGVPDTNVTISYWVLDTDYDSYALVYTCENMGEDQRAVFTWKLSRNKVLSTAANTAMNNIISTIPVLDQRYYNVADQTEEGCFYYPEPVASQPVVFPGFCDDSISTVTNFNLNLFSGLWYEISAYPKVEVDGECHSYDFSVSSTNAFTLISNQIVGLSLESTDATMVGVTTDGTARFQIVLTRNGTEIVIPFWILSTDYTNYALAYSCVNLDDDMRGVYSWKLSRTKELIPASQALIAFAMSNVQVLEEQYFVDTDQSDDACFYLPDITQEEPVVFVGQCDENLPTVANFDAARYTGQWYDIESYYDTFQMGTCNDALYTLNPQGVVDVYNTQVVGQELDTITGTAVVASTDGTGKLAVTFPIAGTNLTITTSYWILDTDYDSYSLVYSCSNLNTETRRVYSWKLSRTRSLPAAAATAINAVVSTVPVLDSRYYIVRDHTEDGCFYYPEPNPNSAVIFRGQCDESVTAIQNFNVAAYTGFWYDVGSYPQEFQDGSCPTATYTLNAGGFVDVYNTQVVNQQLDDITGTATLASTDGSGQLIVNFPIAGTEFTINSPYWVLATDYTNYALVYACTNINSESYRVTSWKLGRQTTLPAASETAINNAMANVRALDDRYYVNRGHTDADCFFYPDNEGGPVILDGVCSENQTTVSNFDINAFTGPWYETARFPSEMQTGECSASDISVVNQNVVITQTIIYNERQTTVQGTVVASPNGVLTVTFTLPDGGTETMIVSVLDTDYTEYALLFSCRTINANQKQIYSWQLSRSRAGLSSTAQSNINSIVSENEDLFELYYDETEQSVSGCFYYPEFEDDASSIVLPGPCDETIQAMPNFSVADYLGRWYSIERYPQFNEEGECARATYTLGAGAVDVRNEMVINQTLDVMLGSAVVASQDGSGLLDVTFVLEGGIIATANYYVLSTDYDNYALAYSCRNLDGGNRQVSSWKLSREPTLDSQYNAIIDPIIENTQGLLQEYYSGVGQTADDCFYIPELNQDEDVIFRGQCEDVSGVQGFNVQSFLGWWHEIESYPTSAATGDCISSQYQSVGSSFVAVDTSVFGLDAVVNASTVTVSANGLLTRTSSNGQTSNVWVLATDYDSYALLYSCENINNEYRRVWSAKHSKARQLSAAAQAAVAPYIEGNQVLRPEFYLPVDQSDSACFHYPEQTGRQIILPGQCATDIPVQQNFDAVQYTGTWYQIERYPQIHELGSCTGARYSLDEETGVVTLLNWEVVDGVLDTVEGNATIISTDGSAQLLVNLPIRGTEEMTSYVLYVLSTDYTTYSLAYSCVNVNDFQRAVGVWKLSRTRTMPSTGATAINAYMDGREELHQPYFIQTEQSEDCEEPSSSFVFKSSLILMLVCAILQLVL